MYFETYFEQLTLPSGLGCFFLTQQHCKRITKTTKFRKWLMIRRGPCSNLCVSEYWNTHRVQLKNGPKLPQSCRKYCCGKKSVTLFFKECGSKNGKIPKKHHKTNSLGTSFVLRELLRRQISIFKIQIKITYRKKFCLAEQSEIKIPNFFQKLT